jgi:hypothetical protein
VLSPGFPSTPGDEPESLSAAEQRLFHLQRQLDIETKAGHPLLTVHRLFFTLIQCYGSMKFWYGSGSADPYLRLMDPDPDPAILISDLQTAIIFFSLGFLLLLFESTFTSFFKDKKAKRSHKTVGMKVFLTIRILLFSSLTFKTPTKN